MGLLPDVLNSWPPGGWQFFQPETGWHAPTPLQFTFNQQVNNIIAMRKQNPRFKLATDYLSVARELEAYTCARLNNHPKYCLSADGQKKTLAPSHLHHPSTQPAAEQDVADVGVDPAALREWVGAGMTPVALELAERRAAVCAECNRNTKSPSCPPDDKDSWLDWMTPWIAAGLKKLSGIKHHLKMATSHDEQLGKCLACRCELELKVFVPLPFIVENMGPITTTEIGKVKTCWVNTEQ